LYLSISYFLILNILFISYFYLFPFLTEVSEQTLAFGAPSEQVQADRQVASVQAGRCGLRFPNWHLARLRPSLRGTVQGVTEERKLFKISD
jgi:hypothetical protein